MPSSSSATHCPHCGQPHPKKPSFYSSADYRVWWHVVGGICQCRAQRSPIQQTVTVKHDHGTSCRCEWCEIDNELVGERRTA